jgi:hypothetical protein
MAQNDLVIANQSFPSFRSDLNSALQAIQTTHSGTSLPTGALAGQIWLDTTNATSPTLKFYDGTDSISLATINYTANTVDWLDSSVTITGLSTTATGTVLTLTDTAHTTSVNMILGNNTALRFNELTANGSNYIGLKAPASLSADLTFTLPSTDGTSGQFLKTDGSGNLSFASLSFATPLAVVGDATAGASIRLPEDTDNGSNYVAIKAPDNLASNLTLTLPSADGTSGQVLQTNGSGVLSFASASANTPAFRATLGASQSIANNTQVKAQFNTEDFDTNNCYDPTTNYRFTPTTAGKYFVGLNVRFNTGSVAITSNFVFKNGSQDWVGEYSNISNNNWFNGTVTTLNGSSDYIEIYVYQNSGGSVNIISGQFFAYRLIGV